MSYFNDFAAGYQMTSGKRERDRDRADKIDQEKLRKEFEVGRDVERYKQEDIARRAGYDNQTNQRVGAADAAREAAERGYEFTGGEGEKGRTFTAAQSTADRDLRQKLQTETLNQAAKQFGQRLDLDTQNMGLMAGLNARKQDALTDPLSLTNQLNNEKLIKLRADNASAGPLAGGKPGTEIRPEAIDYLRKNPKSAEAFRLKYGVDPQKYLGR